MIQNSTVPILAEVLGDEFDILEAENGEECMNILEQYERDISLVLLDIVMPVMDGFEVLTAMAAKNWNDDIPGRLMISSEDSEAFVRKAYEMGVVDYINRPFDAQVVYRRVFNTIKLYAKQTKTFITLVTDQIYEKQKNNQIMIGIVSQIDGLQKRRKRAAYSQDQHYHRNSAGTPDPENGTNTASFLGRDAQ